LYDNSGDAMDKNKIQAKNMGYYLLLNNLNDQETAVIQTIIRNIESGAGRVSITQVAAENYVSTAFISKLGKKLGFSGYTELYYHLQKKREEENTVQEFAIPYDEASYLKLAEILEENRQRNAFVVGEGFGSVVANYISRRMAICGFLMYSGVHFYDYVIFREQNRKKGLSSNIEASFIIAISQSGETANVLENVKRAKQHKFKAIAFTRVAESRLAREADVLFLIDPVKQVLVGQLPNTFFGKTILLFEQLLSRFLYRT
jgi:DNA-binding MurR/RpiR family transcriptional regulator